MTCPTCGVELARAPEGPVRCDAGRHVDARGYVGKVVYGTGEAVIVITGGDGGDSE